MIQQDFLTPFETTIGGDVSHAKKARGVANNCRLNLDSVKSKLVNAKEDKVQALQDELNHAESDFDHAVLLARNAMKAILESVIF